MGGNLEQSRQLPDGAESANDRQRKENLLKDVLPAKTRTIEVAQVSSKQVPGEAKPNGSALDKTSPPKNNDDIFTHPPRGMAVFADFITGLKPTNRNESADGWFAEKDRPYITTKLRELASRAKLEKASLQKVDDKLPASDIPIRQKKANDLFEKIIKLEDFPSEEGFPSNLTQGELIDYLKEEYSKEAQELTESSGRLQREEVFGPKWGENTLVGAAASQERDTPASRYFKRLSSAISHLRSVPEAIKYVDFATRAEEQYVSTSTHTGLDAWRMDEKKKRFVVVIEGTPNLGTQEEMSREKDLHNSAVTIMVSSLNRYGTQIDDQQHRKQFENALEGKYNSAHQGQGTMVIKYVKPSEKPGEGEKLVKQAQTDMEKFRLNNPDAEFMIIEAGHGDSYKPKFAYGRGPTNLGDYYKKEGSWGSTFQITTDFTMYEDKEKEIWQGAAGNKPLIVLKDVCRSGAAIAKHKSSAAEDLYLTGDISP